MRATNNELTSWVHQILNVIIEQSQHLFGLDLILYTRHKNLQYILTNLLYHRFISLQLRFLTVISRLNEVVVLCRNNYRINTLRDVIIVILHRYLAFRVWSKVEHVLPLLTNIG